MKKRNLFGWFAMAAMVIGTSCSSDEVVNDYSADNAIQFGTYVGRDAQGRATSLKTENLTNFGVFAYYTGTADYATGSFTPNFMYNQKVEKSLGASTWEYEPEKYWPNNSGDKVSFYAYAPHNNHVTIVTSNGQADDAKLNFNVDPTTKNQVDLLWAKEVNRVKQPVEQKVKFNFAHALSRIGFKVESIINKVNEDGTNEEDDAENGTYYVDEHTTVKVTKVRLLGNFANTGTLNLNGGTWENASQVNTAYELTSDNFNDVANAVENSKKTLNKEDSYLMIIPQTTVASIEVTYDVITQDAALAGSTSKITNVITSAAFDFTFGQGNAYTFCLHLGMTSVKFDAEVTPWNVISDISVNVPLN